MESDYKKRVLVTGGAGYVGQVLLQNIPENWKTTVIDNVYVGNDNFTPNNNVEFVNTLPPFSSNYKDAKFSKEWLKDLVSQGIRFGLKFNF